MSTPDEPQDEQALVETDGAREEGEAVPAEADAEQTLAVTAAESDAPPDPEPVAGDVVAADEPGSDGAAATDDQAAGAGEAEAEPAAEDAQASDDGEVADEPAIEATAEEAAGDETAAEPEVEEDVLPPVADRGLIEALLFAADEPLTPAQIKKVLGGVETSEIRAVLETIRAELDERKAGFALIEVAGGFQFRTRPEYGVWIRQLRSDKPPKLSKPALETLAVVSYKQPVTRAEIEAIRRVDTGAVLKTLLDRRLLKVVGTKDVPGRPALYGTSKEFLEVFRLKSLKELPTLKEIRDVAVEMGDALDVPRELLPEEVAAVLPPLEGPVDDSAELGAEHGEDGGEPEAGVDDPDAQESPAITQEPVGSAEDEPAPSPPSAAAEED